MTSITAIHVAEPDLRFGLNQTSQHPKDGLFLYGPVEPRRTSEMRVGAIGAKQGIERLIRWMQRVRGFIRAFNDRAHHAPFPGVEAAFQTREHHLDRTTARDLMGEVVESYKAEHGVRLQSSLSTARLDSGAMNGPALKKGLPA